MMSTRARLQKRISRLFSLVLCFAVFSGQIAHASFELKGRGGLVILQSETRGKQMRVSENVADTRFRAVTDSSNTILEVELVTGETSTFMADRRDGVFQSLSYSVKEPSQITKYEFVYAPSKMQYELKRVVFDERKVRFHSGVAPVCAPNSQLPNIAFEAVIKTATEDLLNSGKIKKSCEKDRAELAASIAEVHTDKPNRYLTCAIAQNLPKIEELKLKLLEKDTKNSLSFECADTAKSSTLDESDVLKFGQDALAESVTKPARTDIVFHELLHAAGIKEDSTVDLAVQCCGAEQNADSCTGLQMLVNKDLAAEMAAAAALEKEKECPGCRVATNQAKREAMIAAAKAADTQLAKDASTLDEGARLKLAKDSSTSVVLTAETKNRTALVSAGAHAATAAQVLPAKMTIQVGAADNAQTIQPTIAKYRESSEVLGRQVGKLIERAEPTFVATANAAPIYRGASSHSSTLPSRALSSRSSVARNYSKPSQSADGEIEFSSVSGQVSSMRLPDGELKSFSIPFSKSAGFGEAKIETSGNSGSRVTALTKSSLITPSKVAAPASSGPIVPRISAASQTSGGGSETGSSLSSARSVSNNSAPKQSSSGSNSPPASSSSGASFLNAGTSGVSLPKPNSASGSARSLANEPEAPRSVASWTEARNLLVTSSDPKQLLVKPWFQKHLVSYKTQVIFQGVPYGPKALKVWKLDPYWKKSP